MTAWRQIVKPNLFRPSLLAQLQKTAPNNPPGLFDSGDLGAAIHLNAFVDADADTHEAILDKIREKWLVTPSLQLHPRHKNFGRCEDLPQPIDSGNRTQKEEQEEQEEAAAAAAAGGGCTSEVIG